MLKGVLMQAQTFSFVVTVQAKISQVHLTLYIFCLEYSVHIYRNRINILFIIVGGWLSFR